MGAMQRRKVERWLEGDGPEPSAQELAAYILARMAENWPADEEHGIAAGPPKHAWLPRVAALLASLTEKSQW